MRMCRWLVGGALAVITMIGCAAQPYPCRTQYVPSVVAGRPFLWEVRGPRGAVTMFGTYQTASGDDVPAEAWAALDHSTVFVAETNEVSDPARVRSLVVLPPGILLQDLLGKPLFQQLASLVTDEATAEQLQHMKPWVAMMLLTRTAFDFPSENISAALLSHARERRVRAEFFDTLEQQVQFLHRSAGTIKLEEAIRSAPQMRCGLTRRLEGYRAGDDVMFTSDIPDDADPIIVRLARWQLQIEGYLDRGEAAFIAVGTANLLGPYGLLATLQHRGFEVRRVGSPAASLTAAR